MAGRPMLIEVPGEIAEALVEEGLATDPGTRRSSTWQVIASVATGAGTTISLLQGPQTVAQLAAKIKSLFHKKTVPEAGAYVEAIGPKGQMRVWVTAATTAEDVKELLEATVFGTDEK